MHAPREGAENKNSPPFLVGCLELPAFVSKERCITLNIEFHVYSGGLV